MTENEETEMHALAVKLEELTRGTGWEAMRYLAIGRTMERLAEYSAVCDCKRTAPKHGRYCSCTFCTYARNFMRAV